MTDHATDSAVRLSCPQCGADVALPAYADVAVCGFCGSTLTREVAEASASTGRRGPEEQVLRSVQCSQCAGPLSAREGRRIIVCDRCGVRFVVREHGGVSRWFFPSRLDRLQAAAAAATWLDDYPGVSTRARNARLIDAKLIFVPIWEHKSLAAGWEFGYKVRTRNELVRDPGNEDRVRLELQMVREGVKESRLQERRFYQAAADFEAIGATRPRVTGRELLMPLLAGELDTDATVLTTEGSAADVAHKGRRAALQPLSGAYSPDSHLFVFRESVALLYYPLWSVQYEDGGRPFRVVVNGRDGSVNGAVAPAARGSQIMAIAARLAVFVLVVGVLVFFAATREAGRIAMIVAAAIVSVIAAMSVVRYRTMREVEYHEPFSG